MFSTTNLMELVMMTVPPIVVMALAVIATRIWGFGKIAMILIGCAALWGAFIAKQATDVSCAINESECLGAIATVYVLATIWFFAFLICAAVILKFKKNARNVSN